MAIRGRNRTDRRAGVPMVNHAAKIVAIDRLENRAPERGGTKPCLLKLRQRRARSLVKPQQFRFKSRPDVTHRRGSFIGQLLEVIRRDTVDQMQLAASEADHLHGAVLLNRETNGIQIGQRAALRIPLPVMRILLQQHFGSGLVIRNIERSEHGRLFLRRLGRQYCDLIEEPLHAGHRGRERERNPLRTRHDNLHGTGSRAKRIAYRRV